MSIGFAMLVHDAFDRAAQVARYWSERGCPVAIHVDQRVAQDELEAFRADLDDLNNIRFCKRFRCDWGTWSLVAASQEASSVLLDQFPQISHVFLASGSCLPLRPAADLITYLKDHPDTDFIESVTIDDVPWTQGGLDIERFTLTFPFGWKSRRFLFDQFVRLQRFTRYTRRIPDGLSPHLGSQWWCLTRETLTRILAAPERSKYETFFRTVWIPDESYFQTLSRLYSRKIESRSLTLSKFDFQGKPHIFFDDHLQLLRRSDCFVARKAWPEADLLYETFLSDSVMIEGRREPQPGRIDRVFSKAVQRRTRGRVGLKMPGRFPNQWYNEERTAAPYSVFWGFDEVFVDFANWVDGATEMCVHGRLYDVERVRFAEDAKTYAGALSDKAELRDYSPSDFLRNLIWNTRGERQGFQYGPEDLQVATELIAADPNATIMVVTGAWAIGLFRKTSDPKLVRKSAAELQRTEAEFVQKLREGQTRAHVRILSLAELLEQPMDIVQMIIDESGATAQSHLTEVPQMHDLTGFDTFVQGLKNQGMNPYLVGDFHSVFETGKITDPTHKPYLVR